ncbi:integumentary mucin C.1-like, partial [Haliotis asinina]|uniref:integumentary mucin C.1-like n=1 Tax=Haliotis asinina TaxID=109174 RepID=UPI0035326CFC
MDSTTFLSALILHFSLCATAQGRFDGRQDVVLPGSVFQTFRRTTVQQCRRLCVYSLRCLSVNWSSSTRECQLNSKKGNVESLQVSDSDVYLPVQKLKLQGHPCVSHPCSTDHMCIPVNTAKGHVCAHVDASMPQTTEAGVLSKAAATTITVSTTSSLRVAETTSTTAATTTSGTTPISPTATTTSGTTPISTTATTTSGTTPISTTATTTSITTPISTAATTTSGTT